VIATDVDTVLSTYCDRIAHHLEAVVGGQDPWHHLLSVELLARAARAERWEADHVTDPKQGRR
jgi:hypothetical protein